MTNVSIRYIVDDVQAAISFYTGHLGFTVDMNPAPGFALLSRGDLRLFLNALGAGGAGQGTLMAPFLLADDVTKLLVFIENAFSGTPVYSMKSSDGVVRHATIRVGNSILMISSGTEIYGKMSCILHLYVEEVDSLYAQSIRAGGVSLREPRNEFYGDRTAAVVDA